MEPTIHQSLLTSAGIFHLKVTQKGLIKASTTSPDSFPISLLVKTSLRESVCPKMKPILRSALRSVFRDGKRETITLTVRNADGNRVRYEVILTPYDPDYCHVLMIDITRFETGDSRPSRDDQTIDSVFSSIPNLMLIISRKTGRILHASMGAVMYFGMSRSLLKRRNFSALFPDEKDRGIETHQTTARTAITAEGESADLRFTPLRLGGRDCFLLTITLLECQSDKPRPLCDDTKSLTEFSRRLGHDLKDILGVIISSHTMCKLRAEKVDEDSVRSTEEGLDLAQYLVSQLISSPGGKLGVKLKLNLPDYTGHSLDFVFRNSRILVQHHAKQHQLPPILAGKSWLSHFLQRLFSRIRTSMSPVGVLKVDYKFLPVGSHSNNDNEVLPGQDGWVRMEMVFIERPANRVPPVGSRVDNTPLRFCDDWEIALLSSHISGQGGYLGIENGPGNSIICHAVFPAGSPVRTEIPATNQSTDIPAHILLLEDCDELRHMTLKMLEHLGYRVSASESGERAVEMFQHARTHNDPCQLLLLDLVIHGGIDGEETLHRIREIDPGIKAILITGYSDDEVFLHHHEHGFDAAVAKPITINEIHRMIRKLLTDDNAGV